MRPPHGGLILFSSVPQPCRSQSCALPRRLRQDCRRNDVRLFYRICIEGRTSVNTPTHSWKNVSATPAPFKLVAGMYELTVHAETWDGGSVTLQRLAADGATYATAFKVF